MTVYMKKNDRIPLLRATLTDAVGAAINLTGATVVFRMRNRATGAMKIVAGACALVDAAAGIVQYSWAAGDTDTVGAYEGEFAVTLAGLVETVPGSGHVLVLIEDVLS